MSLQFLNAFKFLKKDTIVHNLDPRSKLLFAIIYTISALLFVEVIPLLIILLTLIPIILIGKMFRMWFRSIRGMSFLFFLTVDPNDLALSLISMKVPYEFAFSFSLAFRFVPTIAREAQNIMDAQQSRGYELQQKGIISQIKNLFPLLVPLIISSIKRAFNVAEALESRAFGSDNERSYYFSIKFRLRDWIFISYLIIILAFFIIIRLNFNFLPSWLLWSFPL